MEFEYRIFRGANIIMLELLSHHPASLGIQKSSFASVERMIR
jgi:hypothetical protein